MPNTRIQVLARATDPILQNGVRLALRTRPEVWLVEEDADASRTVGLVAADRLDERTMQLLKTLQGKGFTRIVLVSGELEDTEMLTAVEAGVCAVAHRADSTPDTLVRLVTAAAAGQGEL